MKKKIIFVLMAFSIHASVTAQNNIKDDGVMINGVRWATRNVDEAGAFADLPESPGKLYQWNRNTAWSATDSTTANWNVTIPMGDEWEKANDPSPAGWRVPTMDEIGSLFEKDKVHNEWLIQNGINGLKFTDMATSESIFLPAAGYRLNTDGILYYANVYGAYWSNAQSDGSYAYGLFFSSTGTDYYYYDLYRSDGRPVRPVKE